jgi:signal transduction histidine kinase
MNPIDTLQITDALSDPRYQVTGAALDRLRNPLTTILGRAQLLERHIRQGTPLSPDDYLATLSDIERSVRALEGQLWALQDERNRQR